MCDQSQQPSSLPPHAYCTLSEVALHYELDNVMVQRLRRRLRGKHWLKPSGRGFCYAVPDVERAILAARLANEARQQAEQLESTSDPCPGCGTPLPRVWFVDRCPVCLARPWSWD